MNWWDVFTSSVYDFFNGIAPGGETPQQVLAGANSNPIADFLNSAAGSTARAIESGVVALLKDLWDVIIGPVEVVVGIIIILFAVGLIFKNDIAAAARVIP